MNSIEEELKKTLLDALNETGFIDNSVSNQITLEVPSNREFGDFSTNISMRLSKELKRNPLDIANIIKENIKIGHLIEKVEAVKPGFLNIYVSKSYYLSELKKIVLKGDEYGSNTIGNKETVIVEFSSPNIGKPLTVGHLRSTIIGDSVARILEFSDFNVKRDNHIGDWGASFGKLMAAMVEYKVDLVELKKSKDVINELASLYVRFNNESEDNPELKEKGREWFRLLEEKNTDARKMWEFCIDITFTELNRIYKELMIKPFTENGGRGYGESFFEDRMEEIIKILEDASEEKILDYRKSEGAWLVFFDNNEIPPLMILKSNGTTLYSTRDLATDKFRLDFYKDPNLKVINEIGGEQSLYMRQLFKIEEKLGWFKKGQRVHVGHGLFRLKDGKMSTRKGNVIWLNDIVEEVIEKAKTKAKDPNDDDINKIAIGALKWNDLKRDPKQDIVFDREEIMNLKGNSSPYMQYTYVRGFNILKEVKETLDKDDFNLNISLEDISQDEIYLLKSLTRFESIVLDAATNYAPALIANYLFSVAQMFNNFYEKYNVLKESDIKKKEFRISLVKASNIVIKNGMKLLGIEMVESM